MSPKKSTTNTGQAAKDKPGKLKRPTKGVSKPALPQHSKGPGQDPFKLLDSPRKPSSKNPQVSTAVANSARPGSRRRGRPPKTGISDLADQPINVSAQPLSATELQGATRTLRSSDVPQDTTAPQSSGAPIVLEGADGLSGPPSRMTRVSIARQRAAASSHPHHSGDQRVEVEQRLEREGTHAEGHDDDEGQGKEDRQVEGGGQGDDTAQNEGEETEPELKELKQLSTDRVDIQRAASWLDLADIWNPVFSAQRKLSTMILEFSIELETELMVRICKELSEAILH